MSSLGIYKLSYGSDMITFRRNVPKFDVVPLSILKSGRRTITGAQRCGWQKKITQENLKKAFERKKCLLVTPKTFLL